MAASRMHADKFSSKLKLFVERQKPGLVQFFPDYNFDEYSQRGADMVETLVDRACPREIAEQFAVLALYDLVILLDDSSSMEYEDGGNRKDMLKKVLEAIADVYELAREEGIVSVRFLNNPTGRKDIKKADVAGLHAEIQYDGVTMTGTELQNKILKPFVLEPQTPMRKPLLTMIITDGDIEGEKQGVLKRNINNCLAKLDNDSERTVDSVAFMFARIGDDPAAKTLIEALDDDDKLGAWIDCLPVDSHLDDIDISTNGRSHWDVLRKLMLGGLYEDVDEDDDIYDESLPFEPHGKGPCVDV